MLRIRHMSRWLVATAGIPSHVESLSGHDKEGNAVLSGAESHAARIALEMRAAVEQIAYCLRGT